MRILLIGFSISIAIISVFQKTAFSSERYPTESEIGSVEEAIPTKIGGLLEGYENSRPLNKIQQYTSFLETWTKVNSKVAPFVGEWSASIGTDAQNILYIYPSQQQNQLCMLWGQGNPTRHDGVNLQLSTASINNGKIKTSKLGYSENIIIIPRKNRLWPIYTYNARPDLGSPYIAPAALPSLQSVLNNFGTNSQQAAELRQNFQASGCIDSQPHQLYKEQGDRYYANDEYQQAIASYSKAIELSPRYASLYYNRALSYDLLGNKQAAIADLEKSVQLYREQGNKADYKDAYAMLTKMKPSAGLKFDHASFVRSIVGKYSGTVPDFKNRIEYIYKEIDLNNDGTQEIVIAIFSPACGAWECKGYILQRNGNSYKDIGQFAVQSSGGELVTLLPDLHGGFHDIASQVYDSKMRKSKWRRYRFDGSTYRNTLQELETEPTQYILTFKRGSGLKL
jgi:tetratricopeptide (TPR) repeat protein